jgi:hypothetical protein
LRSRGDRGLVRHGFLERSGAVFKALAFVIGLDDVAMMREAIEQRRRHWAAWREIAEILPDASILAGWSASLSVLIGLNVALPIAGGYAKQHRLGSGAWRANSRGG